MANIDFIDILRDIRGSRTTKEEAANDTTCIYGDIVSRHAQIIDNSDVIKNNIGSIVKVASDLESQTSSISTVASNLLAPTSSVNVVSADLSLGENSLIKKVAEDAGKFSEVVDMKTSIDTLLADKIQLDRLYQNIDEVLTADDSAALATQRATEGAQSLDRTQELYDAFDQKYLGAKMGEPEFDNNMNQLIDGALYFSLISKTLQVYNGISWEALPTSISSSLLSGNNLSELSDKLASRTNLDVYSKSEVDTELNKKMNISTYDTTGSGVVDNSERVNNHTVDSDVPANAIFTENDFTNSYKSKIDNIEDNAKDDQSALEVPFSANGDITSTNTQDAIVELRDDTDGKLDTKLDKSGGTITGPLQLDGDLIQNGASYETHAEQVFTTKDEIILRDGAVAALSVGALASIRAKLYDGVNDGIFGFDNNGIARVGDEGSTQALATREDSPIDTGMFYWDAASSSMNSTKDISVDSVTVTGLVDGRDVSVDGSKLDAIGTEADFLAALNYK